MSGWRHAQVTENGGAKTKLGGFGTSDVGVVFKVFQSDGRNLQKGFWHFGPERSVKQKMGG